MCSNVNVDVFNITGGAMTIAWIVTCSIVVGTSLFYFDTSTRHLNARWEHPVLLSSAITGRLNLQKESFFTGELKNKITILV